MAALSHNGTANFIVDAYADGGQSNHINEIGHYTGEVQLPDATFLIAIHADGTWTLTRSRHSRPGPTAAAAPLRRRGGELLGEEHRVDDRRADHDRVSAQRERRLDVLQL